MAQEEVPLTNPFTLTSAIKFPLFFAAVVLVVEVVKQRLPGQGLYLVAGLAGLTFDVDAITLSMASFARDGGDPTLAANAIGIAALSNTLVKAGMVATLAATGLKVRILVATGAVLAAGVAAGLL